jgi:hypothetical protein
MKIEIDIPDDIAQQLETFGITAQQFAEAMTAMLPTIMQMATLHNAGVLSDEQALKDCAKLGSKVGRAIKDGVPLDEALEGGA